MNAQELIQKAQAEANSRKSQSEIMRTVGALVSSLQGVDWDKIPLHELESTSAELSAYMFTLSKLRTDANLSYNASYFGRKVSSAKQYFRVEAKTVSEKEKLVEKEIQHLYENEAIENYWSDIVNNLYKNCDRMVSTLQSIMANRRSEKIQSKQQT